MWLKRWSRVAHERTRRLPQDRSHTEVLLSGSAVGPPGMRDMSSASDRLDTLAVTWVPFPIYTRAPKQRATD